MAKLYIPSRGDVVWTDVDSATGHEQKGKRPALVLSTTPFSKNVLLALVAPITSRVRGHGFEVSFTGEKVSGGILCQQIKMLDFKERGVQFAEKAPEVIVTQVLAKVRAIVSE